MSSITDQHENNNPNLTITMNIRERQVVHFLNFAITERDKIQKDIDLLNEVYKSDWLAIDSRTKNGIRIASERAKLEKDEWNDLIEQFNIILTQAQFVKGN